ncbi:MAG: response regulator transcription factor [Cypionkella sp.]
MPPLVPDRQRVCILDDDASVRWATENLVRSLGYSVASFGSAEAFLTAGPPAFDCLICDVQMPGMSGIELFETLRAQGLLRPTIFITAFSLHQLRVFSGPDVLILAKPFRSEDLVRGLRAFMPDAT